jgi:hypothetical protein
MSSEDEDDFEHWQKIEYRDSALEDAVTEAAAWAGRFVR